MANSSSLRPAAAAVVDRLEAATSSLKRYMLNTARGVGGAAASASAGGTGPVAAPGGSAVSAGEYDSA